MVFRCVSVSAFAVSRSLAPGPRGRSISAYSGDDDLEDDLIDDDLIDDDLIADLIDDLIDFDDLIDDDLFDM